MFLRSASRRASLLGSSTSFTVCGSMMTLFLRSVSGVSPMSYAELRRDHHPRREDFATLTSDDLSAFRSIERGVLTDTDDLRGLNEDWLRQSVGLSRLALRPDSSEQVASILRYCNERSLAVSLQGGNTGLVGGSVPVHDEIILSLSRMNRILSFDPLSGVFVCEAGCILENVDSYLRERQHLFPLDLGAKGSCQVGGNLSTNAGGLRFLRYGSLHGSVLGVEVVLADGTILDLLKTMPKDNTGYDLKQLFIGSEGTLGVITKVAIKAPPLSQSIRVGIAALNDFGHVLKLFALAKQKLGEILSAFEFIDERSLNLVLQHNHHLGVRNPLPRDDENPLYPFYALLETSGSNGNHDEEKISSFFEEAFDQGYICDAALAQNTDQTRDFWRIRESVPESISKVGHVYKYDISLPLAQMYDIVGLCQDRLREAGKTSSLVVGYGHLGDGNLHLNIASPKFDAEVLDIVEPFVFEWTANHRGSVSAEHGIGTAKPHFLHFSKSQPAIDIMQKLKMVFDPKQILNPYKVLP